LDDLKAQRIEKNMKIELGREKIAVIVCLNQILEAEQWEPIFFGLIKIHGLSNSNPKGLVNSRPVNKAL